MSDFTSSLRDLGWQAPFADAFAALPDAGSLSPGRVVLQQRGRYRVVTAAGECSAELSSRLRKEVTAAAELPCVGDWVALIGAAEPAALSQICARLPRLTKFSRKAAGLEHAEQVLAANVDTVFIAMGLDGDFNPRRLERYLTVAWASGAQPVVLLTKADLCAAAELPARLAEIAPLARDAPVLAVSVIDDQGLGALDAFLGAGQTIALFGSSGVGKSTLVNALLRQDVLPTGAVRASDSRGRHTTTQRQLFRVRGGALIIDSPGIRELQLWDARAGFSSSFADVDGVAKGCRFRDCRHQSEPGCAVIAAVARGELSPVRVASYAKLIGEQTASAGRFDPVVVRGRKGANTRRPT